MAAAEAEIARYRRVESSEELREYKQLQETVSATEFQQKKERLIRTKYKDTESYRTLQELKTLRKNKALMLYMQVKDSAELKDYLTFRNSEDYLKLSDKKLVKASPELQKMQRFERSKAYKSYEEYKASTLSKRYEELEKLTGEEAFQKENAFWMNPKRWLSTDEHAAEARMAQLASSPDIRFFLSKDAKDIETKEAWKLTFADEMQWGRLDESAWKSGFSYKSKKLLAQHSFANEQQANNNGKNTGAAGGCLALLTKRETVTAPAWDEKKGFINKEFQYTSDVVQTADAFRQQEGLFMIKLRCTGAIHHAAWLGADGKLPLVNLFHFNGKKIVLGNVGIKGFDGITLSGIPSSQYYIYSLRWTKNELIWYVNNFEVFRTSANIPAESLYLALSSFIAANQKPQEGRLEVDWVRVYKN